MENTKEIFQSSAHFTIEHEAFSAGLVFFSVFNEDQLREKSGALLHPEEIIIGNAYASDIRRRSFLQGRIAAKMALKQVFPAISPTGHLISTGCLGAPYIKNFINPYGVSIAHNEQSVAGLCFPLSVPMGIDLETINENNQSIIPSILSDQEKKLCKESGNSLEFLHILWTAKEAAGKAIGLGFRVSTAWYEIDLVETISIEPYTIRRCRFKELSVLTCLSISLPQGILSIAFPAQQGFDGAMARLLQ